jgi:hypothetical protein
VEREMLKVRTTPMPNFLVIGTAKSGTTALYRYLKQHPQIYMSPLKEPHFFDNEGCPPVHGGPFRQPLNRVVTDLNEYLALFDGVTDETAIGDASMSNFYARACERIQHYMPIGKFICMLRQPVDRAYSQFVHARREGVEPLKEFYEAYRASVARRSENWWGLLIYERNGFYVERLRDWFARFRREQIRIYLYDDWLDDAVGIVKDIFCFLNVDPSFAPDMSERHNVGRLPRSYAIQKLILRRNRIKSAVRAFVPLALRRWLGTTAKEINEVMPPPLDPELRRRLTDERREEILTLQNMIGRDLTHWLEAR